MSRKTQKSKKTPKKTGKALDKVLQETTELAKKRGRPGMRVNLVVGWGYNNTYLLNAYWSVLKEPLLKAETKEDVEAALQLIYETQRSRFMPYSQLILEAIKEKKFPKTDKAQTRFIAESIAGQGIISARRARDICTRERSKVTYKIIRREYFIECTCGYKGPAKHGACQKCGTTDVAVNAGPPRHLTLA